MKNQWKLYWVTSDGYEDCFIIAKNSRSAKSLDYKYVGFDSLDDLESTFIMNLPDKINSKIKTPCYADDKILKKLGAQYRILDKNEQILLNDVVYSKDENGFWKTYLIGAKAIQFNNPSLPKYNNYINEPVINIKDYLLEAIGISLNKTHEIESLFSHAFIFCVSEKDKNKTIDEYIQLNQKRTFGKIITEINKSFDLDPQVDFCLKLFLKMRNQLVHGITTTERYNINTDWGQRELLAFLDIFLSLCEPVLEIASACVEASINFAYTILIKDPPKSYKPKKKLLYLFADNFKIKTEK